MSKTFRLTALEPDEHEIQDAILRYLALDRRVAWAERFNTGAHVLEDTRPDGKKSRRFIKYAFKGCSDILGQTTDGRFLAIEVKTRTGKLTTDQRRFLDKVHRNGGIGIVARSSEDVQQVLDAAFPEHRISLFREVLRMSYQEHLCGRPTPPEPVPAANRACSAPALPELTSPGDCSSLLKGHQSDGQRGPERHQPPSDDTRTT